MLSVHSLVHIGARSAVNKKIKAASPQKRVLFRRTLKVSQVGVITNIETGANNVSGIGECPNLYPTPTKWVQRNPFGDKN